MGSTITFKRHSLLFLTELGRTWGRTAPTLALGLFLLAQTAMAQYDYAGYVASRNTVASVKPLFAAIVQRYPNIDVHLDPSNSLLQLTSTVPVVEQDIADAADEADFALFFFSPGVWGMGTGSPDPQAMSFPQPGSDVEQVDPDQYAAMKADWIQANPEAYERLKHSGAILIAPRK